MGSDIDFVLTWVDGKDPQWQQSKADRMSEWSRSGKGMFPEMDDRENRYRDMGLLKYWFRAVETYAPWVRRVYLVVNHQIPEWLDLDCDKLVVVNQEDFMPAECVPSFNSVAIELFFHKIEGLSERFVYFNDDFMLNAPVRPSDFFVDGKPVDMLAVQPVIANPSNEVMTHMFINNSLLLARHFNKKACMRRHRGKFLHIGYPVKYFAYNFLEHLFPQITGFYTAHRAYPLLKSTYESVWEAEKEALAESAKYPFRCRENIVFYVMSEWNKLQGNFVPVNVEKKFRYFELGSDNRKLYETILAGKIKEVILNDVGAEIDFDKVCADLRAIYEKKLPKKSKFES